MSARWIRILAVLLLAGALVEGGARAFFLYWAGKPFSSTAPYVWSPYGLVRNNPALTSPQFQINPNGFRNLELFERSKPAGTFRVILLGGSVLYAGLAQAFLQEEGRVDSGSTIAQYLQNVMAADPDLKGMRVEVINAAVNFNRIVEVSTAYLAEYAFWEPDIVVVFGSANNFMYVPTREEIRERTHNIQGNHPWGLEFERVVNGKGMQALTENTLRIAADNFAGVALLHKLAARTIDAALLKVRAFAPDPPRTAPAAPASAADEETYFRHYAAFADAMVAAARRHDQGIAFFWEYFLDDMDGIKALSAQEARLYPHVQQGPAHRAYKIRMRDRWVEHFRQAAVDYVDPLAQLRVEKETVIIDYLHYTRRGNRLMAETTYQALKPSVMRRVAARAAADRSEGQGALR